MIAEVNGVRLFYEQYGSGSPLILVHANGEDHTIFDEAVEMLSCRFTCYAVDSRGHGRSVYRGAFHYRDMAADYLAFMEALDLSDVTFLGFSDGGIIGLLAASQTDRISNLITCGANTSPQGVKNGFRLTISLVNRIKKDPLFDLMLTEPDISAEELGRIRARTLVLAGSRDLVKESDTKFIATRIPGAKFRILKGEGHGSYVVHSEKIAKLVLDFMRS